VGVQLPKLSRFARVNGLHPIDPIEVPLENKTVLFPSGLVGHGTVTANGDFIVAANGHDPEVHSLQSGNGVIDAADHAAPRHHVGRLSSDVLVNK